MTGVRPTVALLLLDIGVLRGGGGAERFVADVFTEYRSRQAPDFDLKLITDRRSLAHLQEVGRLRDCQGVEVLATPRLGTKVASYSLQLFRLARSRCIDVMHVALLSPVYIPALWLMDRLSPESRPRLTISQVDCALSHVYFDRTRIQGREQLKSYLLHRTLFKYVSLDGVFTWYREFAERFGAGMIRGDPIVVPARHYFVDVKRFYPAREKENRIVYAGRFVPIKRPLFFVQGVKHALDLEPDLIRGWRFQMFGAGTLEREVRNGIDELGLGDVVEVCRSGDLSQEFASSRVFVSTQDYENFSSLSMLEAMACGNAIIARDVGQTSDLVEQWGNGILLEEDSPSGLGQAIVKYCANPEVHERFSGRSREISTSEQCAANFLEDLERFWHSVLDRLS